MVNLTICWSGVIETYQQIVLSALNIPLSFMAIVGNILIIISFLDVTVCRQDNGRLSTKVYHKPTHTERYLSFHSHHPVAHKRAVVKSLIDRVKITPSSSDPRSKEMKHVTAALLANGYPKRFVIDVGKPKPPVQQLSTAAPDDAKGFCILPYIKGTSEPIKRKLLKNHTKPSGICFLNRKIQFRKIRLVVPSTRSLAKIVTKVISGKPNANFLLALKNTRKRWNINTRKSQL